MVGWESDFDSRENLDANWNSHCCYHKNEEWSWHFDQNWQEHLAVETDGVEGANDVGHDGESQQDDAEFAKSSLSPDLT